MPSTALALCALSIFVTDTVRTLYSSLHLLRSDLHLGSCFLEAPRAGILNEVSRISNSITRTVRYDTSVGDRRQRYAAGRGPVGFRFRSGWRGRWSYFTAYDRYDTRNAGPEAGRSGYTVR